MVVGVLASTSESSWGSWPFSCSGARSGAGKGWFALRRWKASASHKLPLTSCDPRNNGYVRYICVRAGVMPSEAASKAVKIYSMTSRNIISTREIIVSNERQDRDSGHWKLALCHVFRKSTDFYHRGIIFLFCDLTKPVKTTIRDKCSYHDKMSRFVMIGEKQVLCSLRLLCSCNLRDGGCCESRDHTRAQHVLH